MDVKELAQLMDELHRKHQQIADLNYRIRKAKRSVKNCLDSVKTANDALKVKQDAKQALLVVVGEKEREAESARLSLERRREQLNSAGSSREYESLKIQIELDERKNDELADSTLEVLAQVDVVEQEIAQATLDVQEAEKKLQTLQEELAVSEPKLLADIAYTQDRLRETEAKLPHAYIGAYQHCVESLGGEDALAQLQDQDFCGACNCKLTRETVMKVFSGTAICCSSCGRLLYVPENFSFKQ